MRFFWQPQLLDAHRLRLNKKAEPTSHFTTMSTLAYIIDIQAALESTAGTTSQDTRNKTMCGATRNQLDNGLAQEQKRLIVAALQPMEDQPATITFDPFQAGQNGIPPAAFLTVTVDTNGSPLLRVISCPKPIKDKEEEIVAISGIVAFTRTMDPLGASVFLAGDIEFTKLIYTRSLAKLRSCRVQLSTAQKQEIATYLGQSLFDAVKNLLPFRRDGEVSFQSPSSSTASRRNCTNFAIPTCWPLPRSHSITLQDDIPLPSDITAASTAFAAFNYRGTDWLTTNPLFNVWLKTVNLDPAPFIPASENFLSLNEASSLADYQACASLSREIIADSMLAKGKPHLKTIGLKC